MTSREIDTVAEEVLTLPVHEERLSVDKRVRRTLVRASVSTTERTVPVDELLVSEQIVVRRVPVGREVDAVPPVREEGGVTIVSVVEEELVLVRRLILKEEVHFERVRTTQRHVEDVVLRQEEVTITRNEISD